MARNKFPEETRRLIVETAAKLFLEKGYEKTSIQDIINNLGGLSKGAIYYHFKSKEEIMYAVADLLYADSDKAMAEICRRKDLNGRQKLREIFRASVEATSRRQMTEVLPDMLKNPQFLVLFLETSVQKESPDLLTPVIEEGISDGSIVTDYPRELAEVLMLLGNLWLNPLVYKGDTETVMRRVSFYKELTGKLGLDLVTSDMLEILKESIAVCEEKEEK